MSMLRRIVWPALLLAVALATGCAHAPPAATSVALLQPLPGLYTAGQPAASDWAAIKARGVRTVVNLRAPGELKDRDEAAEVRAAGLRYVEIRAPCMRRSRRPMAAGCWCIAPAATAPVRCWRWNSAISTV